MSKRSPRPCIKFTAMQAAQKDDESSGDEPLPFTAMQAAQKCLQIS